MLENQTLFDDYIFYVAGDMELLNSLIHDATETRFWSKRNIA
jgi:hypothetical protein